MDAASRLKRIGERAAGEIDDGMIVGLGTGSTASAFVKALGDRVAGGLTITGVTTSAETARLAQSLDIPVTKLDDVDRLNVCVDGADEIDPNLNVVKGRGGALLFEKLVARRADRYIIIASAEKLVNTLGSRLPLPVEIIPVGWTHTAQELELLDLWPRLRYAGTDASSPPFLTDGGHYIVDCETDIISNPPQMASRIKAITGVVDHGLFIDMVNIALTIDANGAIATHVRPAS